MEVKHNESGVDTAKWGKGVWNWLHRIPEAGESVERIAACLDNLCLPCPHCQNHYDHFLERHPVSTIKTRGDALVWTNRLHNEVNQRLGKPIMGVSECKKKFCESSTASNPTSVGKETVRRTFQ